ncbi:MAG: hypothetical protein H7Y16_04390 [Candidatus Parcubacteria bacterium]|nr:hypothetical protein [Burkholderiales bacterium]
MLLEILKRTPPWVFVLFVVLVFFGIMQSRTRHITLARVTILPVVLIGMSLSGLWSTFGANAMALAVWLAAIAASLAANSYIKWPRKISYSPETRSFLVQGSWIPLAVMMVIFFARYAINVALAMQPGLAASPSFAAAVSAGYGLLSGAFLARAWRILAAAKAQPAGAG